MRIYVAGLYSKNVSGENANVIEVLANMRVGLLASMDVLKKGHAPFVPWIDFQFGLVTDGLTVEDYYRYSIAWLEVSEAALFLPGWQRGRGTIAEHELAVKMGIPIYYSPEDVPDAKP